MTVDASNLLKLLGLGTPAIGGPGAPRAAGGNTGTGQTDFSALLEKARSGELTSNLPVEISEDCGVNLSEDQLAQLSLAADKAEAAGIRNALVILDDQQVMLDVHQRKVTGKAELGAGPVGGIDGVINLSSALAKQAEGVIVGPPSGLALENAAVTKLLEAIGVNGAGSK